MNGEGSLAAGCSRSHTEDIVTEWTVRHLIRWHKNSHTSAHTHTHTEK